jgi:hypothetical protein
MICFLIVLKQSFETHWILTITQTHTSTHTQKHTHTQTHTQAHTHTQTHTKTHTQSHTHTHIYIHICFVETQWVIHVPFLIYLKEMISDPRRLNGLNNLRFKNYPK